MEESSHLLVRSFFLFDLRDCLLPFPGEDGWYLEQFDRAFCLGLAIAPCDIRWALCVLCFLYDV